MVLQEYLIIFQYKHSTCLAMGQIHRSTLYIIQYYDQGLSVPQL